MKAQLTAVLEAMRWPWPARMGELSADRSSGPTIGQILAALDDRDTRNALKLLDPPVTTATPERRIKCAGGCGE
jgi:hypothetical protein